jgi:probable phosphomutase (TIGR03848 family)
VLAGRLPGVNLDAHGRAQAKEVSLRLAGVRLSAAVTSPQTRCRETARLAMTQLEASPDLDVAPALAECDYGEWQGQPISDLAKLDLWKTVQRQPSAAAFPGGESIRGMQQRAVSYVRERDAQVEAEHGPGAVWLAVSHGDIIKSVLADALGMHIDLFQRLNVDPASVSVIRYTADRPYVLSVNSSAGPLGWLNPAQAPGEEAAHGAVVGGGAGPDVPTASA